MTIAQANVTPVVKNSTLETVTLKNLVALDIVEQNEAVLSAFGLLDNSATRLSLPLSRTTESLQKQILKKKEEVAKLSAQVKELKSGAHASPDAKLMEQLANEFLMDDIPATDADDLLKTFEKENGITVVTKDADECYRYVDGSKLKKLVEKEVDGIAKKDADGDVEIVQ